MLELFVYFLTIDFALCARYLFPAITQLALLKGVQILKIKKFINKFLFSYRKKIASSISKIYLILKKLKFFLRLVEKKELAHIELLLYFFTESQIVYSVKKYFYNK